MAHQDPVQELPLSLPVFQILLSLYEGPMHGYAILSDIHDRTDTAVELGAGTLYAAIRRMVSSGMVEECPPPRGVVVTDSRRRYYRVTRYGRVVAKAEARRLQSLTALASARKLIPDAIPAPRDT